METRIGQLLFTVALLAGLVFAAPFAPWDEVQLQVGDAFVDEAKGGMLFVPAQANDVGGKQDMKQAAMLRKLTAQLASTLGSSVWPDAVEIRVQDAIKKTGHKSEVTGLEVVFEARSAAKMLAAMAMPLEVPAPAVGEKEKIPRVHAQGRVVVSPPKGNPTTFDQLLSASIDDAARQIRTASGIPVENLLPGVLFAAASGACDLETANGLKDTGVDQACVKVACPEEDKPDDGTAATGDAAETAPAKTCGKWKGQGTKPAQALPSDVTKALQWKIAAALRADYGSQPAAFKDEAGPKRLRGDFARTEKTGTVREKLYASKALPKPGARLAQIVHTKLIGLERDASLNIKLEALAGGAPKEFTAQVNKPFPSTSNWFWIASALAAVGCVLWRVGKTKEARASAAAMAQSESTEGNPFALLRQSVAPIRALQSEIAALDEETIMTRVDAILTDYVLPFGEVRNKVTETLGMGLGAEILVVIAYGERMLNRTWTAASDGHAHESRKVFPDVVAAFEKAQALAEASTGAAASPSGAPSGGSRP